MSVIVVVGLLTRFSHLILLKGDLISHYLLVDEIMKHGQVRAASFYNIGFLAHYPSGSHWLAAIVGWVQGSGLYGISFVSIVSVFVVYLMIFRLVGSCAPVNVCVFAAILALTGKAHSQIGWEISGNYFYPQLVADVLYFCTLIWLARKLEIWSQAAVVVVSGAIAMGVQPLVALHILAAGAVFLAYQGLELWINTSQLPKKHAVSVIIVVVATALLAMFHPSFAAMRQNAEHNGELMFGYSNLFLISILCGAIGASNLVLHLTGRTHYTDAVLGSAGVASVCLMFMQFIALQTAGAGSDYAVKKHMFIIVTIGSINATRVIASFLNFRGNRWPIGWAVSPILAGLVSAVIVHKFDTPIEPIEKVLSYANKATKYDIPNFAPGEAIDIDVTQSPLVNLTVTLAAFQHPFYWIGGADLMRGVKYVMVHRTQKIDANCAERFGESAEYVLVPPSCLRLYSAGELLDFRTGNDGYLYLGDGWSVPDDFGTWSQGGDGSHVNLVLEKGAAHPHQLTVNANAFVTSRHPKQSFDVEVNGVRVARWDFDVSAPEGLRSATIPEQQGNILNIAFKALDPAAPATLDPTTPDVRSLGIHLRTLVLQ
ncbi:hypothetical protein [Paraburkholderia saeva]|uniref:hypothetical protein n=1 Tax=Paraburkholderia saeva TaxID=2777537 RepID=UPI001E2A306B|nr:hypothetical protein [Paraburkholderia saeva]